MWRHTVAVAGAGVVLALTIFGGSVASAQTSRASQGDAQAVLDAFGNGGWAIRLHSQVANGAPADADHKVGIRPFDFFNRLHYCALDWHTILIADIEGGDASFTQAQATAAIADIAVQFTLDGSPLPITQTPVKSFLNPQGFGFQVAYYSQWGRVMAPSDLALGGHSLSVLMTNAAGSQIIFANKITFFIDAGGTGACL
jgi:hypothetical protein